MQAIMKTRDQLPGIKSSSAGRIVSLDFNHSGRSTPAYGIEIKMPQDSTKREISVAQSWAYATHSLLLAHDHNVPMRGDQGVKIEGRGVAGFIHTEPFFVGDVVARMIVHRHAEWYCKILKVTLGQLPNVTFILPHKSNDPGAQSRDGIFNERDFAKYVLMPHLQQMCGQEVPVFDLPTGYESAGPQVSIEEVK